MAEQQQPDRDREHERRNEQQKQRNIREGISKPPPSKQARASGLRSQPDSEVI